MKCKVAIILENISAKAGTERAVVNLSNILIERGYYVSIVSLYTDKSDDCYYQLDNRVAINHLNKKKGKNLNKLFFYPQLRKSFEQFFKNELNYDYILGTTHAINCILSTINIKAKKIGCEHMNYDACPGLSKLIRKILYHKLDKIVVLTEGDKKKYKFLEEEKVVVIPNSLSFVCDKISSVTEQRIIAVGRLTKQKGFDLLLDSAKIFLPQIPGWRLDIFGDGEEKNYLLKKVREFNLEKLVTINKPTDKIKDEMINSSIFILSSRWEGFVLVLMEAMECGLPSVCFNCPEGPSEIIEDGINGFLVPRENIKIMAEKVIALAKDKEKRIRIGKNAHQSLDKYSSDAIYQKWSVILKSND